jgi:hypothetical protein
MPRSISDYKIDEALWAAYRRYDKSAVTAKLLRHYLAESAFIPDPNTAPDSAREFVLNKIISGRDRSEGHSGQKTSAQTTPAYTKALPRLTSKPGKGERHLCSALKRSR